jgi:hypothetical protein
MTCLSWRLGDPDGKMVFTIAANPVFLLTDVSGSLPTRIEFEVLEDIAGALLKRVGSTQFFYIDDLTGAFAATIGALMPVTSTHHALEFMRDKPTLRGYLDIMETSQVAS